MSGSDITVCANPLQKTALLQKAAYVARHPPSHKQVTYCLNAVPGTPWQQHLQLGRTKGNHI